ncbi:ABC transporter substrate-binding protein [Paenibacillus crassostreae]|uniref:Sugar transporter n=1 Tax=Paenibacillus crassostreae TaxID=1763538 RepID=A0A167EUL5_9BACL|nr:extracellular solute-binding protein [Paenibacillus crassostreae]AOZ93451.1 sugar transporter [Paenibacillus crassostreae]OAB75894.1 sugar transporter [Paenibacillus crassostreae]
MKRVKHWTALILIIMLVASLAACGGNGNNNTKNNAAAPEKTESTETKNTDEATEPAEKVELSFWSLGTTNYEDLAKKYTEENPNITIKFQNTSDQTAHHNNLTTALSADSGAPDIFMLEIGFMERFINAQDKFQNLNDFGAKDIAGNYLDWKWKQASSVDGSFQLGLPTDIGPTVAYYRVDLAEQAGLPVDPEGFGAQIDTWDKFATVAKDFTAKTGKPFADLTDLVYNALRDQSADQIYFNKEDGSFIGDTNPQVKKAYDFTVQGIQEGWIGNTLLWSPEWGQAMNDGGFGVILGPAWMAGNIKSNAPDSTGKWKIAQLPEGAGNWGGSFLTIPKEGKHPQEAYDFISWLDSQESQLESFKASGLMPSIPALYEDAAFTGFQDEFFGGQATAVEYGKAAERVKPVYYGPLHDQTDTFFKDALKNVLEKKADPTEEWDAAVKKAKTLAERS